MYLPALRRKRYNERRRHTGDTMIRTRRLTLLTSLIRQGHFSRQEELVDALKLKGVDVTQATLSRDLNSLGVVTAPGSDGRRIYALAQPATEVIDRERRQLDLREFVNQAVVAGNLLVVKTPPGHAHGVGRAIDLLNNPDVVGTVAGDDTVLVVTPSPAKARAVKKLIDTSAGVRGRVA